MLNKRFPLRGVSLLVIALTTSSCSPSCTDGDRSIPNAPGFSLFDSGGGGKVIVFEQGGRREILIEPEVKEYLVRDGKLFVARLPLDIGEPVSGGATSTTKAECEYWSIELKSQSVMRESGPVEGLSCRFTRASKSILFTG